MPLEKEPEEFYEPGDPRSFGKPPKSPDMNEWIAFWEKYNPETNPENYLKLLHGQAPEVKAALDVIARDRFCSTLPTLEKGVEFLFEYLPAMARQFGVEQTQSEEELPDFYYRILSDLWEGDKQIGIGGQETLYISLDKPPEAQSYEYLGEKIARAIRRQSHQDRSYKTQAFFGWIGRHVMKKVCPETDFSLDRHREQAEKDRVEVLARLGEIRERIEEGVEGEITPEKVYEFFGELYWQTPHVISAETPLWYRVASNLMDTKSRPTRPDDHWSETFENFWKKWKKAAKIGIPEVTVQFPWEKESLRNCWQESGVTSYETMVDYLQGFFSEGKLVDPRHNEDYGGLQKLLEKHGTGNVAELPKEEVITWYQESDTKSQQRHKNYFLYYLRDHFNRIFGEVLDDPEKMALVGKKELVPQWYEMLRFILLEELAWITKDVEKFEVTYFRFIENKPVAEGYAFAQKHIEEILDSLPEIIRLPEKEIHRRFFVGEPPILSDEHDLGFNSGDDIYRKNESIYDVYGNGLSLEKDEKWVFEIYAGPNAAMFEELKSFEFTEEEWLLGIYPLFFGFYLSDVYAKAYQVGRLEEFYQERREETPLERERERIEELKAGIFALPQTPEDLIKNANLQIERLKQEKVSPQILTRRRIKVMEEVKEILEELIQKGLLKLEQASD